MNQTASDNAEEFGFHAGDLVQEWRGDDDVDDSIRAKIEELTGEELVDEDYDSAVDGRHSADRQLRLERYSPARVRQGQVNQDFSRFFSRIRKSPEPIGFGGFRYYVDFPAKHKQNVGGMWAKHGCAR